MELVVPGWHVPSRVSTVHGAVELDYRGRIEAKEHPIQRGNLRPVGRRRCLGLGMQRGNGRLDLVRTNPAPAQQSRLDELQAFADFVVVPQGAILFLKCLQQ